MPLIDDLGARDERAIARALSALENDAPGAAALRAGLGRRPRRAFVVGVTGPPGAGKSTLVDRLVAAYRATDATVAVLAVDPSSPFTGGAILGDRVRMQAHAGDRGVFIRSMASRGQLGGLARSTAEAAAVLDAAGFDIVVIETVGVGQAEVDIAHLAHVVLVVTAPGAGDDVQALKAGLMEIGDIFVVNKADREGADRTASGVMTALSLQSWPEGHWRPPVLQTVATSGQGVSELMTAVARFREAGVRTGSVRDRQRLAVRLPAATPDLDHVGIAVRDAASLADLLRTLFGLPTGEPEQVGSHRLRFVEAGPAALELVEPLEPDAPIAKFIERRGEGLHHLCLRVHNIEHVLDDLKARGVRLIDEHPRAGARGSRIAFLHPSSTGGVLIEIKED